MKYNHYAIVIGINEYPGISDLEGPCNDANDFYEWLIDSDGGDLPPENIDLILSDNFLEPPRPWTVDNARPQRDFIYKYLRKFSDGQNKGERIYIFVAGHGFSSPSNFDDNALITPNASEDFFTHIPATRIANWMRLNYTFDEVVLLMDSCRDTSVLNEVENPGVFRKTNNQSAARVKYFFGYASEWNKKAREKRVNGKVRGNFTIALMDALKHAKPNRLGNVTGSIIKKYIHNSIDPSQDPTINIDEHRDIIWFNRDVSLISLTVILNDWDGNSLKIEREEEILFETDNPQETNVVNVLPGIYKISTNTGSKLIEAINDEIEVKI